MHIAISLVSALPYTVNISTATLHSTFNVRFLYFLLHHCKDCCGNLVYVGFITPSSSLFLDCVYLKCSLQMFMEKNDGYWDFLQGKIVCQFVSRVGWIQGLAQVTPLPSERVRICGDPQIHEFPLHHYGGLGTRTRENL